MDSERRGTAVPLAHITGRFNAAGLTPAAEASVRSSAQYLKRNSLNHSYTWSSDELFVEGLSPRTVEFGCCPRAERDGFALLLCGYLSAPPSETSLPFDRHDGNQSARLCLDVFIENGLAGIASLQGSFLLVILNRRLRRLFLITDRFNSRITYYEQLADSTLVFSTSLRGLYETAPKARAIDLSSLRQFLTFGTIFDEGVLAAGVRALPPASALSIEESRLTVASYFELRYESPSRSLRQVVDELAGTLNRVIARQTSRLDGATLMTSGGLDSRLIVALSSSNLNCVTLADYENREVQIARQVAAARGFPFAVFLRDLDFYSRLIEVGSQTGDDTSAWSNAAFADPSLHAGLGDAGIVTGYGFDMLLKTAGLPTLPGHFLGWRTSRSELLKVEPSEFVNQLVEHHPWSRPGRRTALRVLREPFERQSDEAMRADLDRLRSIAITRADEPADQFQFVTMYMMAKSWSAFNNVLSLRGYQTDYTVAFDNELLAAHAEMRAVHRLNGLAFRKALLQASPVMTRIPDANTGLLPSASWLQEHLAQRFNLHRRSGTGSHRPPSCPWATDGSWPDLSILIRANRSVRQRIKSLLNDQTGLPDWLFDRREVSSLLDRHLRGEDHSYKLILLSTVAHRCRGMNFSDAH